MTSRIGIVYFGRYPDVRVAKFAETLAKAGLQVVVLCRHLKCNATDSPLGTEQPGQRFEEGWRANLRIVSVTDNVTGRLPAALSAPYHVNPIWRRAIRELVTHHNCELLIVRDLPLMLAATAVGRRYDVPVIFDMAENYPAALAVWRRYEGPLNYVKNAVLRNVALARALERYACRQSNSVVVVVPESAQRVMQMGVDPEKIVVVENTPDLTNYDSAEYTDKGHTVTASAYSALNIIYTGEIHVYRGIDTCIEALSDPRIPAAARFWLVGSGKKEQYLRNLARRGGVEGRVRWCGWHAHPAMRGLIAQAEVGIVPHHLNALTQYTMPNKLYDYMALSKPVIVSDVRPMRRVVMDTKCGVVFRAGSSQALAEAILQLRDPTLRAEMGANGRRVVEDRYNWSADSAKLVALVARLLSSHEPRLRKAA